MNFRKDIYILDHIKRYSTTRTIVQESVASHSFFVAALVLDLADKYRFNHERAVCMAICHDMPEIELNDLPRPIKLKFPKIYEAFKEYEKGVIAIMPDTVRFYILEYVQGKDSVEGLIVKLADTIQCLQFAENEIQLGNRGHTDEIVKSSYEIIHKLEKRLKKYER